MYIVQEIQLVTNSRSRLIGIKMNGDDDMMPMMQHEIAATASLRPMPKSKSTLADAVKYHRPSALLLAVVTFLLFTCSLIFLIVSLIVPIFQSLDAQQQQQHVNSNNTSNAAAEAIHAGHSTEHHHKRRRSALHLVDTLRQLVAVCRISFTRVCLAYEAF